MISEEYKKMLMCIEKLSIPYYLETKLREEHSIPKFLTDKDTQNARQNQKAKIAMYNEKIKKYISINYPKLQDEFSQIKPIDHTCDFRDIALNASLFFQQGKQMLFTSLDMPESSSPLVEYYGYLQCIKGAILLELSVDFNFFFKHHGVSPTMKNRNEKAKNEQIRREFYLRADIKKKGVLQALLIRSQGYLGKYDETRFDCYLNGSYKPTLEYVMGLRKADSPNAFLGSWMLSTIVRYEPKKWQSICSGLDGDLIDNIRTFRRNSIPNGLRRLIQSYVAWYNVDNV